MALFCNAYFVLITGELINFYYCFNFYLKKFVYISKFYNDAFILLSI